jgi:hypothetical protein
VRVAGTTGILWVSFQAIGPALASAYWLNNCSDRFEQWILTRYRLTGFESGISSCALALALLSCLAGGTAAFLRCKGIIKFNWAAHFTWLVSGLLPFVVDALGAISSIQRFGVPDPDGSWGQVSGLMLLAVVPGVWIWIIWDRKNVGVGFPVIPGGRTD